MDGKIDGKNNWIVALKTTVPFYFYATSFAPVNGGVFMNHEMLFVLFCTRHVAMHETLAFKTHTARDREGEREFKHFDSAMIRLLAHAERLLWMLYFDSIIIITVIIINFDLNDGSEGKLDTTNDTYSLDA